MDLVGSLRHTQLRAAGAPTLESEITSDVRLKTGTMWHNLIGYYLVRAGVPVMREVDVTPWLPEGWGGTADWLFWAPEYSAYVLGDLKTMKGEGHKWILSEGAKEEHMWQLSAYFYALVEAGFPMVKGFAILYLPITDVPGEQVEPEVMECDVLPRDAVYERMNARWEITQKYLEAFSALDDDERWSTVPTGQERVHPAWFTLGAPGEYLAPPQERVQKVFWSSKTKQFDVKLVPHWSTDYCPFPNELCDCSEQGTTKIGHYAFSEESSGMVPILQYVHRKGFEDQEPALEPTSAQIKKRWKEVNAS